MASKHQRRVVTTPSAARPPLRQEVDRLIAKERYKDAVKQAKICFKEEPTPEHHRLLERAYLLRAQQLRQGGMPAAAQENARHLLDFGITDPELVEPAAALMLSIGMAGRAMELQGRLEAPEARGRLARHAADQAVLHPDREPASMPDARDGALRVRAALEALGAGDEAKALAELRDVARNSPFSDWKLFVRGLAAFRRKAADEARANWDRLEPGRAPAKLARALAALDGRGPGDADQAPGGAAAVPEALERSAFGEPVLGPLKRVGELAAQERWTEAVREIGPLRFALRRVDPTLAERLTAVLYTPLVREATRLDYREAKGLVGNFTRVAEPLPIDPRWNRLWAQLWEGPSGDIDQAEVFWRRYLDDLKTLPALRPEDREWAQALVLAHLGEIYVDIAADLAPDGPVGTRERVDGEELDYARRRAVEILEESLRLCPTHRESYQSLIDAYKEWGQPARAAEVSRRLLRALPDDFDALVELSEYHFRRDEPAEALDYARRARALKPLDETTIGQEWAARVALARHHARHGRWDEGRAELEAADKLRPDISQEFLCAARKAAFELKAGQTERANAIIAEAQGRLAEPTPLWLALRIEATRYELPGPDQDRFEALWVNALSKRPRGETAGALADLLASCIDAGITYPGRDGHVKQVVDYLGRTTRIKYTRRDLSRACAFLGLLVTEPRRRGRGGRARGGAKADTALRELYEKLARRGLKLFPDAFEFPMLLGSIEMEKGPFRGDLRKARQHFERAQELAQAAGSGDPKAALMARKAREALSALKDLTSGPMGFPFSLPGGLPDFFTPELVEEMADELGVDLDDFDEDDDFDDGPGPDRPARAKKTKKRKR
jgi:tetratricopeptide (TPR) repeat protein